jgi:hypothetical protein
LVELNTGGVCASGTGIIDNVLGSGAKSGYKFTYTSVADATGLKNTYSINAVPGVIGTTGQRGFFSDQTGVVRYTLDGTAPTAASSALQ